MVIMHILNLYTHINLYFFCKKTNIQFLPFTARDTVPAMVQIELLIGRPTFIYAFVLQYQTLYDLYFHIVLTNNQR